MTKLKESFAASESLTESSIISAASYDKSIAKGGVACPFPWRLHEMLEAAEREGLTHLVSWQSHGRSFTVHEPKEFAEQIMCR